MATFPAMRFNVYRKIKQGKKITHISETFGLNYLTSEFQAEMNKGFNLYDNLYQAYSGISRKKSQDFRKRLHILRHNKDGLPQIKIIAHTLKEDYRKSNILDWQTANSELLQQEKTWNAFEQLAHDDKALQRIKQLRKRWQACGKFAHYPSEALLEIATEILPGIERHLQRAIDEALEKRDRIPKNFFKEYSDYLLKIQHLIAEEKIKLAKAMFWRLRQSQRKRSITLDDDIALLGKQLQPLCRDKQQNAEHPNLLLTQHPRRQLTAQAFNQFYLYIQQQGSNALVKAFSAWQQTRNPGTFTVKSAGIQWQVPDIFKPLTPLKPKWPAWFFKGHQFRCEFFKDKQYTLAAMQLIQRLGVKRFDLEHLHEIPAFIELRAIEKHLQDMQHEVKTKKPQGFWKLWYSKTDKFLTQWQKQLKQATQQVAEKKLALLEQLVDQLANDKTDMSSDKKVNNLQSLLDSFAPSFQHSGLSQATRQAFNKIKKRLITFSVKPPLPQKNMLSIPRSELTNLVPPAEVSPQNALMEMQDILKEGNKLILSDEDEWCLQKELVSDYATLIWLSDDKKLKADLSHLIYPIMLSHLNRLAGSPDKLSAQHHSMCERYELLLIALAEPGCELYQHIQAIQNLRASDQLETLQSSIVSLQEWYVMRCFQSDMQQLDKNFFAFLQKNHRLYLHPYEILAIQRIRDRMITQQITDIRQLKDLDPSEQTLIGISSSASGTSKSAYNMLQMFLNLSAYLHINTKNLSQISQKQAAIQSLKREISDGMEANQFSSSFSSFLIEQQGLFSSSVLSKTTHQELLSNQLINQEKQHGKTITV